MWNDKKVVMTVAYFLWLTSLKFLMEEIWESADLMRKHLFNAFVGNIPKAAPDSTESWQLWSL